MAIISGLVRIDLRYTFLGQKCETTSYWSPGGLAWEAVNAAQGAEAWWNNCKNNWRALYPVGSANTFDSVFFEEVGGGEQYGEYAIPGAERNGTRVTTGMGDFLPAYVAVGCRLTVTTHATRPGQKRFPFAVEGDNVDGRVGVGFLALVANLGDFYSSPATLGAPVALGTLTPQVVHLPTTSAPTLVQQECVGYVLNAMFTSQVSRRPGHGR